MGFQRAELKKLQQRLILEHAATAPRIVVDCSFDHLMLPKELKSFTQQLCHIYSKNRDAIRPSRLSFSGLSNNDSKSKAQLDKNGFSQWSVAFDEIPPLESSECNLDLSNAVYLTADSDNVLTEIKDDQILILGGIVDKNRHKNLCLTRAKSLGIQTAKLDLKPFFEQRNDLFPDGVFSNKPVINVNHVAGILNDYIASRNWFFSFCNNIPMRQIRSSLHDSVKNKDISLADISPLKKFPISILFFSSQSSHSTDDDDDSLLNDVKRMVQDQKNVFLVGKWDRNVLDELRDLAKEKFPKQNECPCVFGYPEDASNLAAMRRLKVILNRLMIEKVTEVHLFNVAIVDNGFSSLIHVLENVLKFCNNGKVKFRSFDVEKRNEISNFKLEKTVFKPKNYPSDKENVTTLIKLHSSCQEQVKSLVSQLNIEFRDLLGKGTDENLITGP